MKFRQMKKIGFLTTRAIRTYSLCSKVYPISVQNRAKNIYNLKCKEITIPVPWGHIAAKMWGNPSGIPILGVHGWQDNSGTFDTLAPLFPESWQFVAVDLSGHGLSSHLPPGMVYDGFSYILQLRHIIHYLNWKKFSYIGHSLGGGLGLVFSALFPQMINLVVVIDLIKLMSLDNSDKYIETAVKALDQHVFYEEAKKSPSSYTLDEATKYLVSNVQGSLTYESASILMKRGSKIDPDNPDRIIYTRDKRIQLRTLPLISTEFLKKLSLRINTNLLILKAKDGTLYEKQSVYDDFLNIYKKHCKKFIYMEVPGTHHVHLNSPENVASHIIDFVHSSVNSSL